MRIQKEPARFELTLNLFEGRLLRQCLSSIQKNYRVEPEQADGRVAACWYPSHSGLSGEDVRAWQRDLHQLRMANLQLIERWQSQLEHPRQGHHELTLPEAEAPSFLAVINDHRLLLAAQHDIGQDEMEMQSLRQISKLSGEKQAALYEIHLLAYLMEELLSVLTK